MLSLFARMNLIGNRDIELQNLFGTLNAERRWPVREEINKKWGLLGELSLNKNPIKNWRIVMKKSLAVLVGLFLIFALAGVSMAIPYEVKLDQDVSFSKDFKTNTWTFSNIPRCRE